MRVAAVFRTYVFPTLRLIVWAVIAVALLWLAFGRSTADDGELAASPSAVLEPPAAQVVRGDVTNTVSLTGTISADAATTVKSTATGEVGRVRAAVGDAVEKGTPLFTVVVPVEETAAPTTTTDAAGVVTVVPAAPRTRTVTVTATVPGTLASLDVLPEQAVSVGGAVATVSPGTLTVSAPLTQEQQFRLLAPPSTAQVTVPGGPGAFECTGLRTGTPATGSTPSTPDDGGFTDPYADPSQAVTGAQVSCRVPDDVQVFAGLSATLDVTAGSATGVLLAPVTAVQGRVDNGSVWVVDPATGEQTETPVTLGLTDGSNVEVKTGVEEGASILLFVPGSDEVVDPYASGSSGSGF